MNEVEKLVWEESRLQRVFADHLDELLEACRTGLKAEGFGVQDRVHTSEGTVRNKWFKMARDPLGELRFSVCLRLRIHGRLTKIELICFPAMDTEVLQSWGTEQGDEAIRTLLATITPAGLLQTLKVTIQTRLGPRNPKAWMPVRKEEP